jgi:hypothetical protein
MKKLNIFSTILIIFIISCSSNLPNYYTPNTIRGVYGPAVRGDGVANTIIGSVHKWELDYRFRAKKTGYLQSITVSSIMDLDSSNKPLSVELDTVSPSGDYSAGDGGNIVALLFSDDGSLNNLPKEQLASSQPRNLAASMRDCYSNRSPTCLYYNTQSLIFSSDNLVKVIAGQMYHIVFVNIHSRPSENYVSLNMLYNSQVEKPDQIAFPDRELDTLYKCLNNCGTEGITPTPKDKWILRKGYTPIYEIKLKNSLSDSGISKTEGMSYLERWNGSHIKIDATSGKNLKIGQIFDILALDQLGSLQSECYFYQLSVRVKRVGTISTSTLPEPYLQLEIYQRDSSGGEIFQSKRTSRIPAHNFTGRSEGPNDPSNLSSYLEPLEWANFSLTPPIKVQGGTSWNFNLSASEGAKFNTFPLVKGRPFSFGKATYLSANDGTDSSGNVISKNHAQFFDGEKWINWRDTQNQSRPDSDLQFYLAYQCGGN